MKKWCAGLVSVVLLLCMVTVVVAENEVALPDIDTMQDFEMSDHSLLPGSIEGTGTYFEVTDSEYLSIILESEEEITLLLESTPEMVTINIESASGASSTNITLGGFNPLTTYYKYEDDYHNLTIFTTDDNGSYSYAQDLSMPHHVFIQSRKSTKFIRVDATGGNCTSIGTWDFATKTCTLTRDLNETIQIESDNITLDGNGYILTGKNSGNGVYLYDKTGVTIKNLKINNWSTGIYLFRSNNNTLTKNNTSNNGYGIKSIYSSGHRITGSISKENKYYDVYISLYSEAQCDNVIVDITGSGDRPIKYFNSPVELKNEVLSELFLCNADGSILENITIEGSANERNNGMFVYHTNHSKFTNIRSSNNLLGFYSLYSGLNTLKDSTFENNEYYGISAHSSGYSTLINNKVFDNEYGIYLTHSRGSILQNNSAFNNDYGIFVTDSSFTKYVNNTVLNNDYGITFARGAGEIYDNIILDNGYGIYLSQTSLSNIYKNNISGNEYGIYFGFSTYNNKATDNTISNNDYGLYFVYSHGNEIYNNNLINNDQQTDYYYNRLNIFNYDIPVGGNYWSNFDTPEEGCIDINNDMFCDSPYIIMNDNKDDLPWTVPNGWNDLDGDGVPNEEDICPGGDDNIDSDGDRTPDFCDQCPYDPENDADSDGICGDIDSCPDTIIPESVPTNRLGVNRFALVDEDAGFDTTEPNGKGPGKSFNIEETWGCSCEQIIEELDLGNGHSNFGCSIGVMEKWINLVNP